MAIPLLPWEPHVFPKEIQTELRRRSTNRGLNPAKSFELDWKTDTEWMSYKGPMTAWVRVCSNGVGFESPDKPYLPGFVMYGGKDFYTAYGFNLGVANPPQGKESTPNLSVIGYTPSGVQHVIENTFASPYPVHVPVPEVEKISSTIQKELLARVRIEWTCFSLKQLEYMTPYFLVPGISVIIEWGWNHFNPLSLVKLDDEKQLKSYLLNPYPLYTENVLGSKGNYEVVFGRVTNFEWSIEGNKIRCITEVTSQDRLYAGLAIRGNLGKADSGLADEDPRDSRSSQSPATTNSPKATGFMDSFKRFVVNYIDKFKDLPEANKSADEIIQSYSSLVQEDKRPLYGFVQYMKERHPENYKEYLFGIYYGRDEETVVQYVHGGGFAPSQQRQVKRFSDLYADKEKDWDAANPRSELWLNMGLVIELMNFYGAYPLKGVDNKPLFLVDVDDCIISGHPNLISTDGEILLIPNAMAPKIQTGLYGQSFDKDKDYEKVMRPASMKMPIVKAKELDDLKNSPRASIKWANYRMYWVGIGYESARDDLSGIINHHRFKNADPQGDYEFPFTGDYYVDEGNDLRKYDGWYTGFFKNLYLNVKVLKKLVQDPAIVTYQDLMDAIFAEINKAANGFWKFKLEGSTGRQNTETFATMKVIDENLTQLTSNVGDIFTFDYNVADGLIQQLSFRPTLSNAQAIRTIYAQTNLTNKQKVVMSGYNELLDYKFRDRLLLSADASSNKEDPYLFRNSSYAETMGKLQSIDPLNGAFQVTKKNDKGEIIKYRLAIPPSHEEILGLLLDDNDRDHNPRYTGIMPGIQAEVTLQGIAGIRTFAMFRVRGLPEPYSEQNIVFRVVNCSHTVQNGQWVTQIVAGIIPLRGYFCSKLGLPPKEAKPNQ